MKVENVFIVPSFFFFKLERLNASFCSILLRTTLLLKKKDLEQILRWINAQCN